MRDCSTFMVINRLCDSIHNLFGGGGGGSSSSGGDFCGSMHGFMILVSDLMALFVHFILVKHENCHSDTAYGCMPAV